VLLQSKVSEHVVPGRARSQNRKLQPPVLNDSSTSHALGADSTRNADATLGRVLARAPGELGVWGSARFAPGTRMG
jgi:hypothetical protein